MHPKTPSDQAKKKIKIKVKPVAPTTGWFSPSMIKQSSKQASGPAKKNGPKESRQVTHNLRRRMGR